jgi:superfamily II DNA or RNA helicase
VLPDVLKQKDIFQFFSRSALEKGATYRAQKRVSALEFSDNFSHIRARVAGSARKPYAVDIVLKFDRERLIDIDGECSCPVGLNCKHVAATLLEGLSDTGAQIDAKFLPIKSSARLLEVRALPHELNDWLERVDSAIRGNDYPAEVTQRILYHLQPYAREGRMPHLSVSLLSVRMRKDGSRSNQISRPNLSSLNPDKAPAHYRGSDIDILAGLSREPRTYGQHDCYLLRSTGLLHQIVNTGRAHWLDINRPPLQWGDIRQGRIEWRQANKEGISSHMVADGAVALDAEPPVYIDEASSLIGPVDTGIPARLAHRLLSAPVIPRAHIVEVAHRLSLKLPVAQHGFLPTPAEAAIKVDENPIPTLRLMLGAASLNSYFYNMPDQMPVAHLSFRYGPVEIELSERANSVEAFHGGKIYAIARRRGMEKEARERLAGLGFIQAQAIYPYLDARYRHDLTFVEPSNWLDFLEIHAADLRLRGFEIHIDEQFPYRLAESSSVFDAELESRGIDWFELGLGIEIDGERRDLTSILAALVSTPGFSPDAVKRLAESGDHFYLPLTDGRYVSLAADRFLPLVLALHTLSLGGAFTENSGKIRLTRADVVPLLGFENDEFVFKGADNLRKLANLLRLSDHDDVKLPADFTAMLRPYQAQGVKWLDLLRESGLGGVLADDMGLGKTVQILALLSLEKTRGNLAEPALVVAPTSLMTNWFNEARKFAPALKVLVLHGAARKQRFESISGYDVVLTTYPLIARDHEVLLSRQWHITVLDEAQTIKNPNAATTRWLRGIKAKHRFCLTGTPMENHLGELWSIMSFANPGFLGDKTAFSRQWRSPIEKRGDTMRAKALARRVKPFLLRRTKAEVATELPPKSEIVESIALEGNQRDLYDSIRLSMSDKVREAIRDRGLAKSHIIILEALLRLRQACCDPTLLKLDDGIDRPSAKLDRLMEMVLELLSERRKILIFSQFTSMLRLIERRFDTNHICYSVLTGETRDRKAAIDGFQGGASDVFLISLKAGGVGLNLTAADTVILFDPWWNPAVEEQAIDRAYRIGQDNAVFVYRLVAVGTIEEKMDELKARKRALADSLFDRNGRIASALTEDDVRALFEV